MFTIVFKYTTEKSDGSGGKIVSEKGQRIYKWIVWISIFVFIFISGYKWGYKVINLDLTKTQWMELLDSKIDRDYIDGYGDE